MTTLSETQIGGDAISNSLNSIMCLNGVAELAAAVLASGKNIISGAGPVGAGKTSVCLDLVNYLRDKGYRVAFVKEQLPEETFGLFLKDPLANAHPFQMAMVNIRSFQLAEAISMILSGKYDFVIMERSVFEDFLFFMANIQSGAIDPSATVAYADQRRWTCNRAKPYIWFFYVSVDFETTVERMCSRDRPGEADAYTTTDANRAYFRSIYDAYPAWIDEMEQEGFAVARFNNTHHKAALVRSSAELDAAVQLTTSTNGSRTTTPEPKVETRNISELLEDPNVEIVGIKEVPRGTPTYWLE